MNTKYTSSTETGDVELGGKTPLSVTAILSSTPDNTPPTPAAVIQASVVVIDGADFITQTDAHGRSISRPPAPVGSGPVGFDASLTAPITVAAPKTSRNRFFQWFCCFVGANASDFEVDEYAHTAPEGRDTSQSVKTSGSGGAGQNAVGGNSSSTAANNASNAAANTNRSRAAGRPPPQRGMPQRHPHIGPVSAAHKGKKCLVLDLDETLVHSSLREEPSAHMTIPVNIDNGIHDVYVIKRPGVDDFLKRMGEQYEVIIYTASLSKYADPLLDQLDIHKVISKRLFRENCVYHQGHYVKDLSLLNRDLQHCIIVDNSPMSYTFHPENAIDCGSFIDDPKDIEMWLIGDFLTGISKCDDVRAHCNHWREWCKKHPKLSTAPALSATGVPESPLPSPAASPPATTTTTATTTTSASSSVSTAASTNGAALATPVPASVPVSAAPVAPAPPAAVVAAVAVAVAAPAAAVAAPVVASVSKAAAAKQSVPQPAPQPQPQSS